jgi:hypothetical protein
MMICGFCGGNPTGALWVGMPRRARSLVDRPRIALKDTIYVIVHDS